MIRDSALRRLIAVFSAAAVMAGCASVRPADPTAVGVDLGEINDALAGRVALVRLKSGSEIIAHDVSISRSSVSFRREMFPDSFSAWPAREQEEVRVSEVRSVELSRRGMGALQGSLLGFGVGAVVGAAVAGPGLGPDDSISVFIGGVFSGLVGSCLGFLVGASLGAPEVYDLTRMPEADEFASHSD